MMKKIFFSLLMLGSMVATTTAQDDPAASLKAAKKSFQRFIDSEKQDEKELSAAREKIDAAFKTDALLNDPKQAVKALMARGDIYYEMSNLDNIAAFAAQAAKQKYEYKYADAPLQAADAYAKILSNPNASKGDKRDVTEYLGKVISLVSNVGIQAHGAQRYADAYKAFSTCLNIKKAVGDAKDSKILDTPQALNEMKYFAGLSAYSAKMNPEATALFLELVKAKYEPEGNKAHIYNLLSNIYLDAKQTDKALEVMAEGRKRYADDQGLLYAEINYYIAQNQLDKLEDRLEAAIQKDPKNKSLYHVKGKMYEGIAETYTKAGKAAEAEKAAMNAETYYTKALEVEPNYFEPLYSLGAMHYNKAAAISQEMNKLSLKEQKKYDELSIKLRECFLKAKPFFERADAVNPKDPGTITALQGISAKLGDAAKSAEYKKRLEDLTKK